MKGKFLALFLTILIGGSLIIGLEAAKQKLATPPPQTPQLPLPTEAVAKEDQPPPEITAIKNTTNIDEQVVIYKKLIDRVGPQQAQEDLKNSGLPFDGQTHLLNHTAGDWLYKKYGTEGLVFCRDYFLSSCYHGFVIYAIADRGFEGLLEIMSTCQQKGSPVAMQCAHAIGHGFLAWVGYVNLTSALLECDKLSDQSQNFPLYNCHDGVFMENVWAVHETGKPSKERWVKDSDPVYPCNDTRIPQKYIKACWSNQPMRMYQMFNQDLVKVAKECLKLTNNIYQTTCFDALARQIHPLTNGNPNEVFRLCGLMTKDWINPCIFSILKAEFGVGGRVLPFTLCQQIEEDGKGGCHQALSDIIKAYYNNNPQEKTKLCKQIPDISSQKVCIQ